MAAKLTIRKTRGVGQTTQRQRETLLGLGLKKTNQVVVRDDTAPIRGMISKVAHLVAVTKGE